MSGALFMREKPVAKCVCKTEKIKWTKGHGHENMHFYLTVSLRQIEHV